MIKLHFNQHGFSALEVAIFVIVLGLVGGTGAYVYSQSASTDDERKVTASADDPEQKLVENTDSSMYLDGKAVQFTAPASWSKDGVGCIKESNAFGNQVYLDSAALLPGEKLRTIYGDGSEYFHVNVCVFDNPDKLTPETWFTDASAGGIGEGTGDASDTNSSKSINGMPAFYRKVVSPSGYEEVHYVVSAKGKLVYVWARTYEVSDEVPGAGDFRKFETPIQDLVESITVKR